MLGAKVDVGLWLVCKRSVSWLVTTSRLTSWPATLGWPAPSRPEQRSIPRKCNNQTYPGSFPGTSASAQQAAHWTSPIVTSMYLNNQYTIIRKHEDNFPWRKHLNWDACVQWTPPVSEGFMKTCQICRHFQWRVECSDFIEHQCQYWRTLLKTPRSICFIPWETLLSILSGTALPRHK